MKERKYGIGGCKHRYNETRTSMYRSSSRLGILEGRCNLRQYSGSDKKCMFPGNTHKNCPLVKGR